MNIVTLGNALGDLETRLYNLEAGLQATMEAMALERNAMMNSLDEAFGRQLQDLSKYIELVQTLRGAPTNVTELRVNNK